MMESIHYWFWGNAGWFIVNLLFLFVNLSYRSTTIKMYKSLGKR